MEGQEGQEKKKITRPAQIILILRLIAGEFLRPWQSEDDFKD